jgi:hypothetical protein
MVSREIFHPAIRIAMALFVVFFFSVAGAEPGKAPEWRQRGANALQRGLAKENRMTEAEKAELAAEVERHYGEDVPFCSHRQAKDAAFFEQIADDGAPPEQKKAAIREHLKFMRPDLYPDQ